MTYNLHLIKYFLFNFNFNDLKMKPNYLGERSFSLHTKSLKAIIFKALMTLYSFKANI